MKKLEFPYVYHSHTERCGHASGKDEEIIIAAIEHGVKVFCITDHTPIPGQTQPGIRMELEQLDEYVATWTALKEKYKDQIEIHIGLEAEYSKEHHDYLIDFVLNRGIEFIICGEHCYEIDGKLVWANSKTYGEHTRTKQDLMDTYIDFVCEGMNKGYIKYFAHPDFFINSQYCFDESVKESARKLIETAIKNDVILEFNIHGIYNHLLEEFKYPCIHFWKLVADEYPQAKVTIGLDCHSLIEYIDNTYLPNALEIIKNIGLKVISDININELIRIEQETFKNMK